MERFSRGFAAAMCVAVALGGQSVLAQTARSGGTASAQLMQQMQELASERTTLQAENDRLKKQLADVTKDRDALKAAAQGLDRKEKETLAALAHSSTQRDATAQELTQDKAKMQELIARFRETIQKLRETETEDTTEKQALAKSQHELSACVDHNVALYHLTDEVLTRWERQGWWARTAQAEPFTKIARVRLENEIDDYRARAQEQRLKPGSPAAAPPAPAAPMQGATPPGAPAAASAPPAAPVADPKP
jgi:chromosome segregation ATPase